MRIPPPPTGDDVPPEERVAYVALSERVGGDITSNIVDEYFRGLMHAPALGSQLSSMGRFFRAAESRGTMSDRRREFVDMVLGVELRCAPVFFEHLEPAVRAGVRPEAVRALLERRHEALTPGEAQERDYILDVVKGAATDAQVRDIAADRGFRGVMEYTAFILFLHMTIRMFQALGVPDPADATVAEMLRAHADGGSWPPSD